MMKITGENYTGCIKISGSKCAWGKLHLYENVRVVGYLAGNYGEYLCIWEL